MTEPQKPQDVDISSHRHPSYRWEQCYEHGRNRLWAIVDDESAASGRVSCHLLVVNHRWADSLGRPFAECELPQRIIALLNADEGHFERAITKLRRYKSPANGLPYSESGLRDLEQQCLEASRAGDSSLLEMAGLAIRRLLNIQQRVKRKLESIVVSEGEDSGVILLSSDSPTEYSEELGCTVYLHDHFSPLGDALVDVCREVRLDAEDVSHG